jgi:hypothetical protein
MPLACGGIQVEADVAMGRRTPGAPPAAPLRLPAPRHPQRLSWSSQVWQIVADVQPGQVCISTVRSVTNVRRYWLPEPRRAVQGAHLIILQHIKTYYKILQHITRYSYTDCGGRDWGNG